MKKYTRYILYGIFILIVFNLWILWQQKHTSKSTSKVVAPVSHVIKESKSTIKAQNTINVGKIDQNQLIQVNTPLFHMKINKKGGDIVSVALNHYFQTIKKQKPLSLLNTNSKTFYISKSGVYQSKGFRSEKTLLNYKSSQNQYSLSKGQKSLIIILKAKNSQGLNITKIYTFKPNEYTVGVDYKIINKTGKSWKGRYFAQFNQVFKSTKRGLFGLHPFQGIAILDHNGDYRRYSFSKLIKEPLEETAKLGWLAMSQRYFISAWIPKTKGIYRYYTQTYPNSFYVAGFLSPRISIQNGQTKDILSKLYIGPKIAANLKHVAPKLDLTVDYSSITFLSLISSWLFKLLKLINSFIGNWGWSIIIITLLIKLVFYRLSTTSYKSMAAMKTLQPKMERIKERYKDNPQERNKAMMELYKKEKINPLGGCLPILVQIPVFIALYYVLLQSVELRHAPFILWIHDLSVKDPYYILPILMGASMWIQQKMTPTSADPTQAKMMMLLPIFLTVLFLNFPAGLVLYWLVNNLLSIAQQWYITKKFKVKS